VNTPEQATNEQINELVERHEMSDESRKLFSTGVAMMRAHAETILGNKPLGIDLTRHPDLRPRWTKTPVGWMCVDDKSYDGPGSPVGWGALKIDALADLIEQIEEGRKPRRAGRVTHSSPFEPPTIVDEPESDPDLDAGYEP